VCQSVRRSVHRLSPAQQRRCLGAADRGHARGRAHLEQAAQANRAIGFEHSVVSINLGWVLRAENDPGAARSMFETALRTGRRRGQHYVLAYADLGLALGGVPQL
jgi:hypothetical protein